MPPVFTDFRASSAASAHMRDKHGLTPEEALEAAEEAPAWYRAADTPGLARRYLAAGRTQAGRRLWVIAADEGRGRARLITAREPSGRKEASRHRALRGE